MSSRELRSKAWNQLKGRYWMVFVVVLIVMAISGASYPLVVGIVIVGPLTVGLSYYLINFVETDSKTI